MNGRARLHAWALAALTLNLPAMVAADDTGPDVPQPVAEAAWMRTFAAQKRRLLEKTDLCFVGDSLTAFWLHQGKPVWDLEFHDYECVNLGMPGDRTEHILYRVVNSDFNRAKPKVIVLLAGTNNLAKEPPDSPEATAKGVARIVETLRRKSPASKLLLVSILPNGHDPESALRKRVVETNRLLEELSQEGHPVKFLDVHDLFLGEDGKWKRGLTGDGTHLTKAGYDQLARKLGPAVKRLAKQAVKGSQFNRHGASTTL